MALSRPLARRALTLAALIQATVSVYCVVRLLAWLREIIRSPGEFQWILLILWLIVCGPIVVGAAVTLLSTLSLARGEPSGWLYSFWLWAILLGVAVLGLLLGRPVHFSLCIAATTVLLLFVSRSAVRDQR